MSKYKIEYGKPYYCVWCIKELRWWGWKCIGWESTKQEAERVLRQLEGNPSHG